MFSSSIKKPKILTISSGKGGVGKTLTSINIAMNLCRSGKSVLLIDGDLGLANIDVLLGVSAKQTLADVARGDAKIEDIILEPFPGLRFIPASSGVTELADLPAYKKKILFDAFSKLKVTEDFVLIDSGAGIADVVINFNRVCDHSIVVTTVEPHALTDAYALIKVVSEECGTRNFELIINQVKNEEEGKRVFLRLSEVCKKFLPVQINLLATVPHDQQIQKHVMRRNLAVDTLVHTISGQAWKSAAERLVNRNVARGNESQVVDLFQNMLWPLEGMVHESTRQAV